MDRELAQVRRHVRTLTIKLRLIDMRRSARWVLDQFRFGDGVVERLAAAFVLAALFFLGFLGVSAATGQPTNMVLAIGGLALGAAAVTSTAFVLGPSDNKLGERRAALVKELDDESLRAAELDREIAVRDAEEADREAEREARRRRTCSFCGGRVKPWVLKCPHCHEYLDEDLAREREDALRPKPNAGVAAVLSFLIPGLGQIYKGQVLSGLVCFFLVGGTYAASILGTFVCCVGIVGIPVGIFLHLICIFDAASGGR